MKVCVKILIVRQFEDLLLHVLRYTKSILIDVIKSDNIYQIVIFAKAKFNK